MLVIGIGFLAPKAFRVRLRKSPKPIIFERLRHLALLSLPHQAVSDARAR